MGSRIRENPKKIFEVFTEIGRPSSTDVTPFVLHQFPDDYTDEEVMKSMPSFAFPCDAESSTVDHFTFVLTDLEGKFRFGFCRHATGAMTCLCIVSCFPWYEIFYKLLNLMSEVLNRSEENNVGMLLEMLYNHPIPEPGEDLHIVTPSFKDTISFTCPDPHQLPSIPENRNLTEYYSAVDSGTMMLIFASMLFERRILITSKKLSRLTACVHGAAALIYPMYWQHLYIPILPKHLIDYCSAPMPFLIGIHSSLLQAVKKQELGDAVILYADDNIIETEYNDIGSIPPDVVSQLKKLLKQHLSEKTSSGLMRDGLSRAFLKTMVEILGGYRDALRFRPGEQITFDPDAFLQSRPSSTRPFLEQIMQTQTFEQFVNDRLETLNAGEGFSDEFDREANMWADKWGTQSRYREWSHHMKRQGKKLRRDGKDKWFEFTSKVRDKSKKTFSDIKDKIGELRKDEESSPATITSPVVAQRPPRPPPPNMEGILGPTTLQRQSIISRRTSYERTRQYKVLDLDVGKIPSSPRASQRTSADDSEVYDLNIQRVSVDLMGDPDIQNVFKKSYSLEDLTLDDADLKEQDEEMMSLVNKGMCEDTADKRLSASANAAVSRRSHANVDGGRPLNGNGFQAKSSIMRPRPVPSPRHSFNSNTQSENVTTRQGPTTTSHAPTTTSHAPTTTSHALITTSHAPSTMSHAPTTSVLDQGGKCTDQLLINLEATGTKLDNLTTDNHKDIEFDPLKQPQENLLGKSNISNARSHLTLDVNVRDHVDNNSCPVTPPGPMLQQPDEKKVPIPRPRTSIKRQTVYYKGNRPQSIRRKSPTSENTNIREAKSAFIQADVSKANIQKAEHLEQFDPLTTGRVALDMNNVPSSIHRQASPQDHEENLLKEWNLPFDKMRGGQLSSDNVQQVVQVPSAVQMYGPRSSYSLPVRYGQPLSLAPIIPGVPRPGQPLQQLPQPGFITQNNRNMVGAMPGTVAQRVFRYTAPNQTFRPATRSWQPVRFEPNSAQPPSSPAHGQPTNGGLLMLPEKLENQPSLIQKRASWQTFD